MLKADQGNLHFYDGVDWTPLAVKRDGAPVVSKSMAFDMLRQQNIYGTIRRQLESKIEILVQNRHEYPMWPFHDAEMDEFERVFHEPIRDVYYQSTIFLIRLLKQLRELDG